MGKYEETKGLGVKMLVFWKGVEDVVGLSRERRSREGVARMLLEYNLSSPSLTPTLRCFATEQSR